MYAGCRHPKGPKWSVAQSVKIYETSDCYAYLLKKENATKAT